VSHVIGVSRTRWAAAGAALAVAVGSGTFSLATADGTASSFVPITPCRLIDTRATSPVGPRSTPITAGESLTVQVTGSNGQCVIPSTATAIVINVTAVGPSAAGYIALYPADVALPNASNLNFTANQNPTPNLVTVSLATGGAIKIFNESGTVNVLGDIAGYYQPDSAFGTAGAACTGGGLSGVVVNGYDSQHNASSKCFTSLVTTLAGSGDANYVAEAVGLNANFNSPSSVAIDSVGNLYVADEFNNRIRKITTDGVVTTLAGQTASGNADGTGAGASFSAPTGVAVDKVGNVYVADTGNHRIRKITPGGTVTTLAGSVSGYLDGNDISARFREPRGVAVDSNGNVYVADTLNNMIRKVTPGGVVSTFAGDGNFDSDNGAGATASFGGPYGVAVDSAGNVYVGDASNHRIRKITPAAVVSTLAGSTSGFADGIGAAAQFLNPRGVAVDALGNVYVADFANNRIRKISAAGAVTTLAGSTYGYADGVGAAAQFGQPLGVAVDASGIVYVAEAGNHRIRLIT